jgi:calcium-translocating P-type ATPase
VKQATPDDMIQPPAPTDQKPVWHAVDIETVTAALDAAPGGLSVAEAEDRLARYGPNRIREEKPVSNLVILLHQFTSPLIYILVVAALVTLVIGEYVDSAVIAVVLALNAIIGFFQERRAEDAVRALLGLVAPRARVVRDGRTLDIDSEGVVPGDLVVLESGVWIPADLRLASATRLRVDESLLTGESSLVDKVRDPLPEDTPLAERSNLAFAGTVVASGRGRGVVVDTGDHTELGRIAGSVRQEIRPKTPLQTSMSRFAQIVGVVVAISATLAGVIGVVVGEAPSEMFLVAVALAVSAIPEGLPVVFTITLAVGVQRMARRNAIVRRLAAVETLGSTTVIGSDKTGTLTRNRMTTQEVWAGGQIHKVDDAGVIAEVTDPLRLTLLTGALTNEASLGAGPDEGIGDPTEVALLVAAERFGVHPEVERANFPVLDEIPFEPIRQYSAAVVAREGSTQVMAKGAPERILDMCDSMMTADGVVVPLDRDHVAGAAGDLAAQGRRVLAMAVSEHGTDPRRTLDGDPTGLVLVGLQGLLDPPREGVAEAIAGCRRSGMRVIMITGDHADTARFIAADLGISEEDAEVLTGADLDGLSDAALADAVGRVSVFARVSPEHKLRVVHALRSRGEVVAVTGDGVNDAPALKAAEIGIAMGRDGTDVAREAAEMVLADDNFVSIYAAVETGRITYDNLRKVTFFLISSGAAEVLAILVALGLRWPLLMLPAQILWLNLITNGVPDVALAFEPGEKGILDRKPRHPKEQLIHPRLWERTVVAGVVMAAGTLAMFWWSLETGGSVDQARTVAVTTMVVFQAFHAGNSRSEHVSVLRISPFSNRLLLAAVAGGLGLHVAALHLPFTQFVFRFEPIPWDAWPLIVATALSIVVAVELHKKFRGSR